MPFCKRENTYIFNHRVICKTMQIPISSTASRTISLHLCLSLYLHIRLPEYSLSILGLSLPINPCASAQAECSRHFKHSSRLVPIWILHPSPSPSSLWQAHIYTLTGMFLLQVIILKSVCRANRKCVCVFVFVCVLMCVTLPLNCPVFPCRHVKK